MKSVVALGSRVFVRQLTLGGALGRVVERTAAAEELRRLLSDQAIGLIMLEVQWMESLPADLCSRAFYSRDPVVIALGGTWNSVLRARIRQVLGADLLAERTTP